MLAGDQPLTNFEPRAIRARWRSRHAGRVREVTSVEPGTSWTWVTRSLGATTTATHVLRARDDGSTHVEQTIDQRGIIGAAVGRLAIRLTRRYLAMEAAGLKRRAEAGVATA